MASFLIEEFVGSGALNNLVPKLLEEGWDNVPTLKTMNSEDMYALHLTQQQKLSIRSVVHHMDALHLTQQQKDAFEIRSYLHDRALMQYGDKLEVSGKSLPELLSISTLGLSSEFGMKRGHIARFTDRTAGGACGIPSTPPTFNVLTSIVTPTATPIARSRAPSRSSSTRGQLLSSRVNSRKTGAHNNYDRSASYIDLQSEVMKIRDGHVFKGIVAAEPSEPRLCGFVRPPPIINDVTPYTAIEKISVQKLTPEYKIGMERLVKTNTPPMKASQLWHDKPALLVCIRRPGCIMCRAEAHQLYSRKPIFDALGIQLIAILHEQVDSEVQDFWPRYWGGVVILDRGKDFFKALGGGKLLKDKFITGFIFNPRARANYKRAKAMGLDQNFKGEGEIKGGLFIVGSGKAGIAYQFIERNFGDWAPLPEVIEICTRLQKQQQGLGDFEESPEKLNVV